MLTDAPIPPDSNEAVDQQAYWGINVTHVEAALAHMLGEGQEVSGRQRVGTARLGEGLDVW